MLPFKGEGDISPSPGHLLLIEEESPVGSSTKDLEDMDPSDTVEPVLMACECETRAKSPVNPVTSAPQTPAQEIVHGNLVEHQVETPHR